jgi:3-hydroxyisobutyrate dehydrogenase
MRVGYVGIGNMGGPMAANLAKAGHEVIVADLDQAAVEAFTNEHETARPANGLAAVAQEAEAVITCLPNGKIVRDVAIGEGDCLADGLSEGTILVDMSSSAPFGTVELGKILAEKGVGMVDAPVSGGVPRAIEGTIAIMVGGEKADIERVRPALETMGGRLFETGGLGTAHAMKSINNVLSATNLVASVEALVIGKKFGLDPENMVDILNYSSGKNSATEGKLKEYVLSRSFDSGFSMDLMIKDVNTALDLAQELGVGWMVGGTVRDMYAAARNHLIDNADNSEIARWIEANGGLEL